MIGKKRRKKEKKKRSKSTCGGEKKRGKKEGKKEGNMVHVWRIKKEGEKKKKKEMLSQYFHNLFTINFNIGEKKIIFLEREKNNFNSTFKLKSVSIFITNVFTILSQLILSDRLL